MSKFKSFCMLIFVISMAIIIGSVCGLTKIYYWCVSPDCFAIWANVMGFVIKIGETP